MRELAAQPPYEPLPPRWATFIEYLDAVAASLTEDESQDWRKVRPSTRTTDLPTAKAPAVIRFDLLAELVEAAVVEQLIEISTSVRDYATAALEPTVTDEERDWLQRLARGERVVEMAIDCGLSQRAMYRALKQLWDKLDVNGRADGMVAATRLGLVDGYDDAGHTTSWQTSANAYDDNG